MSNVDDAGQEDEEKTLMQKQLFPESESIRILPSESYVARPRKSAFIRYFTKTPESKQIRIDSGVSEELEIKSLSAF